MREPLNVSSLSSNASTQRVNWRLSFVTRTYLAQIGRGDKRQKKIVKDPSVVSGEGYHKIFLKQQLLFYNVPQQLQQSEPHLVNLLCKKFSWCHSNWLILDAITQTFLTKPWHLALVGKPDLLCHNVILHTQVFGFKKRKLFVQETTASASLSTLFSDLS